VIRVVCLVISHLAIAVGLHLWRGLITVSKAVELVDLRITEVEVDALGQGTGQRHVKGPEVILVRQICEQ